MGEPFFSVVIPVYNQEKYISHCIESVLNQNYNDYELIIVDDGSTDGTGPIVEKLANAHSKIKVLKKANGGVASARNYGIVNTTGKWICFLDSDDVWSKTKLHECYKAIVETKGAFKVISHDEKLMYSDGRIFDERKYGANPDNLYEHMLFVGNDLSPSAVIIEKSLFKEIGLFNNSKFFNTAEDYDLWIRVAEKAKVYFHHSFLGAYRVHPQGISSNLRTNYTNTLNVIIHNIVRHQDTYKPGAFRFYIKSRKRLIRQIYQFAKAMRKKDPFLCSLLLYEASLAPFRPLRKIFSYGKKLPDILAHTVNYESENGHR